MHGPLAPLSIAAACTAILWSMGAAQAAERKLADFQPFSASVPADFTCKPEVTVTVRAPEDSAFTSNRVELQKLVGGLRAILGFECPNTPITNLLVVGEAGGREVYRGSASESGKWLLADLRSATTSAPAEQATVPTAQGSVSKEASAPEQLPREAAKAEPIPTPTPQQGQQPSGKSAPAPAEQATVERESVSKEAIIPDQDQAAGVVPKPPVGSAHVLDHW